MNTAPTTIGRYKVTEQLGEGGMGTVYLGFDPELERQVAIKILKAADDTDLRTRFTREARSAARLRHPNIVTIFDVGQDEGRPFIAMEFLKGQTLGDMIRENTALSMVRMLHLVEEVCAGLAYAHKSGLVHRDVKPANLMVDDDGVLKILDFGIARVAESGITQAGLLIGTLNYMSPEQVQGQPVDGRSDMFAVGAVFYELLSRQQAFPGGVSDGIFHKLLNLPPAPIEKLCPWLKPEVSKIMYRALEKDRARRYPDVAAMRSEIQRLRLRLESEGHSDSARLNYDEATVMTDRPVTPTPGRRGINKDELEARRGVQVAEHLGQARSAFEQGDYTSVVAQCEQVLLLKPDEPQAETLLERARLAIDSRQAAQWLEEAGSRLKNNDLSGAAILLEQVAAIAPEARRALDVAGLLEQARTDRERRADMDVKARRDREGVLKAAVEQARSALDHQAFDVALDTLRPLQEAHPEASEIRLLMERAESMATQASTATPVPGVSESRRKQLSLAAVAVLVLLGAVSAGLWWKANQRAPMSTAQQTAPIQPAVVNPPSQTSPPPASSSVPATAAATPAPGPVPETVPARVSPPAPPAVSSTPPAPGAPAVVEQPVDGSAGDPVTARGPRATSGAPPDTPRRAAAPAEAKAPAAAAPPPAPPARKAAAVVQLTYDGEPFPLVVYADNRVVGRVDAPSDRVNIASGRVRVRVEGQSAFYGHDFGVVNLEAGGRTTLTLPGTASAFIGVRGDSYAGLLILIDGVTVPMPYPAQVPRIGSGPHQIVFRWTEGGLEGMEIVKKIDLSGGRHFSIRAVPEDAQVVVQKLR